VRPPSPFKRFTGLFHASAIRHFAKGMATKGEDLTGRDTVTVADNKD
jgi:hypothetical protein